MDGAGSAAPRSRRVCLCAAPAPSGEAKRSKRRSWLRSQRSLDQWAPSSEEATPPTQAGRARRTRSAERFEGVRVGEGPVVAVTTPLPLATPTPSACSPPPSYEAAVSKSALPSYEECVRATPPVVKTCACARCKPADPGTASASTAGTCPCPKCQPYGHPAYGHPANVNTAVLISLDTAMHSALADGVALCSLM